MVKRYFFILISIALLFSRGISAQQVTAKASVDSSSYTVGDFINYTITVNYNKNVRVFRPSIKDSLKGIEIIKDAELSTKENDILSTAVIKFVLSKYDSGDVKIPPMPVYYSVGSDTTKKLLFTNPVSFTVRTLRVDQTADIKDVKEPLKIPMDWRIILFWFLGIAVVAGLIVWAVMYYRDKQAQKKGIVKVIEKKPHEIALDSLKELEAKQLWQKGNIKQYHTELTDIIRRYFENRFFISALEMTTSELVQKLSQVRGADVILDITSAFLNNADMVKFAKFVPMDKVNEEMMQQAYKIVEITIPRIEIEEANNGNTSVQEKAGNVH